MGDHKVLEGKQEDKEKEGLRKEVEDRDVLIEQLRNDNQRLNERMKDMAQVCVYNDCAANFIIDSVT